MIGDLYRAGMLYGQEPIKTLDHDYPSLAEGVVIPHGIYDMKHNHGYLNLGTSHDTSEFAVDSLRRWWQYRGRHDYPQATSLLILCDSGGSNGCRSVLFKVELQRFAEDTGLTLRVAHYPPYTSKYNPIDHRLFPHVHRACQGVLFTCIERVKELMAKATTKTGLRVRVHILDKLYQTKRKVTRELKAQLRILFDEDLPAWNYQLFPAK